MSSRAKDAYTRQITIPSNGATLRWWPTCGEEPIKRLKIKKAKLSWTLKTIALRLKQGIDKKVNRNLLMVCQIGRTFCFWNYLKNGGIDSFDDRRMLSWWVKFMKVWFPLFPPKNSEVTVAIVKQCQCFEESGQWLEKVDQAHLVVACGERLMRLFMNGNYYSLVEFSEA